MDPKFAALVETLAPKLARLLAMPPLKYGALPRDMPKAGVCLFTEAGRHLRKSRNADVFGAERGDFKVVSLARFSEPTVPISLGYPLSVHVPKRVRPRR
jgi:hypothetical protein